MTATRTNGAKKGETESEPYILWPGVIPAPEIIEAEVQRDRETDQCRTGLILRGFRGEYACLDREGHEGPHAIAPQCLIRAVEPRGGPQRQRPRGSAKKKGAGR